MPIENFITIIYVKIDDFLKTLNFKLRSNGFSPKLSDSEVITMDIVGEFLGFGSDKAIYEYFRNHWIKLFPNLGCRTTFTRQSTNLYQIKQLLQEYLVKIITDHSFCNGKFLCDGFPIPTCHKKRVNYKNPLRSEGEFGYCATKDEHYFGFKGHILTTANGLILNFVLTEANIDERDVVPELTSGRISGMLIADKGLIRPHLKLDLIKKNIVMLMLF